MFEKVCHGLRLLDRRFTHCGRLVRELAAFGVLWTVILVSIAVVYYIFARRYGVQEN